MMNKPAKAKIPNEPTEPHKLFINSILSQAKTNPQGSCGAGPRPARDPLVALFGTLTMRHFRAELTRITSMRNGLPHSDFFRRPSQRSAHPEAPQLPFSRSRKGRQAESPQSGMNPRTRKYQTNPPNWIMH